MPCPAPPGPQAGTTTKPSGMRVDPKASRVASVHGTKRGTMCSWYAAAASLQDRWSNWARDIGVLGGSRSHDVSERRIITNSDILVPRMPIRTWLDKWALKRCRSFSSSPGARAALVLTPLLGNHYTPHIHTNQNHMLMLEITLHYFSRRLCQTTNR